MHQFVHQTPTTMVTRTMSIIQIQVTTTQIITTAEHIKTQMMDTITEKMEADQKLMKNKKMKMNLMYNKQIQEEDS